MTTVFLRDMSDYDSNEDLTGFVGTTHKATEGTTVKHQQYGPRLNRYHAQGVPVLGAYHVVRTPGSGGNGSLSAQLDFWLSYLDAQTPWWRSHPHFMLQIDLEKWPYDPVSLPRHLGATAPMLHDEVRKIVAPEVLAELVGARSSTGMQFAQLLVDAGVPGWKVTYASRGQYGDNLAGIATPLWNAAYRSVTYPGDSSTDWAPYSGQAPALWQYTSTPFDKNAFRGSLDELLTLIGGVDMATLDDIANNLEWQYPRLEALRTGQPIRTGVEQGKEMWVNAAVRDLQDKLAAGLPATLSDAQYQDLKAAVLAAQPTAAAVAENIDYAALGAAVAQHIKVS